MQVSALLHPSGLVIHPQWRTFEEAVRGLIDALVAGRRIPESITEGAVVAVTEREELASTAIVEIGVSIPHARVPGVGGVVVALAASPTSLYSAMTGVPISIMALVLSAPDLAGEHLNALAALSMLLQSTSVRRALREAADADAAFAIIRALEG